MRKVFEFLLLLAGLYSGIALIFNSYAEWLTNLINFMNEPSAGSAIATILWLVFAGISTHLTSRMLSK